MQNNQYWPNAFIAIAQVFLAVAVGTFFTGEVDFIKMRVVLFNLVVSGVIFVMGWRISK